MRERESAQTIKILRCSLGEPGPSPGLHSSTFFFVYFPAACVVGESHTFSIEIPIPMIFTYTLLTKPR